VILYFVEAVASVITDAKFFWKTMDSAVPWKESVMTNSAFFNKYMNSRGPKERKDGAFFKKYRLLKISILFLNGNKGNFS
jgi:hypothetical protein